MNCKHRAGLGLVLIAHAAGAVPATDAFPQTGLVRDAVTQQPLAGVLILPWNTFDEGREEPVVEPLAEVRTDSTGSYTLTLRSATNVLFWKPGYVFAVFDWAGDLEVEGDCCGNCKIREVFLRPNGTPATATVEQVATNARDHRRRIPRADAATRLERLFYLPSHIHVQNQPGGPAMIVADPESLQTLHLQAGKDMAVGRTSELVYYDGAERIRIARAAAASASRGNSWCSKPTSSCSDYGYRRANITGSCGVAPWLPISRLRSDRGGRPCEFSWLGQRVSLAGRSSRR